MIPFFPDSPNDPLITIFIPIRESSVRNHKTWTEVYFYQEDLNLHSFIFEISLNCCLKGGQLSSLKIGPIHHTLKDFCSNFSSLETPDHQEWKIYVDLKLSIILDLFRQIYMTVEIQNLFSKIHYLNKNVCEQSSYL